MPSFLRPAALLALVLCAAQAQAGDHRYALSPAYVAECGTCHVAFPPALLPAADWRAVMDKLDRHFGTDASVDTRTHAALLAELERNASRRHKHAGVGDPPRLTKSAWFAKEHGRLPDKASPTLPAAAQCENCHAGAAVGDYAERGIRLPANYRRGH